VKVHRTKIVMINPKHHTVLVFKNFASFPTCIFSDKFDTMSNVVETTIIGNITELIIFPTMMIENSNTGSINVMVAICPSGTY